jgi:hypothetical protein
VFSIMNDFKMFSIKHCLRASKIRLLYFHKFLEYFFSPILLRSYYTPHTCVRRVAAAARRSSQMDTSHWFTVLARERVYQKSLIRIDKKNIL